MLTPEGVPGAIAEVFHDGRISIVPISDFTVPQGKTLQVCLTRRRGRCRSA